MDHFISCYLFFRLKLDSISQKKNQVNLRFQGETGQTDDKAISAENEALAERVDGVDEEFMAAGDIG